MNDDKCRGCEYLDYNKNKGLRDYKCNLYGKFLLLYGYANNINRIEKLSECKGDK